jgi:hypothetical protein
MKFRLYVNENRARLENTLPYDDFAIRELLNQGGCQLLIILLNVDPRDLEKFRYFKLEPGLTDDLYRSERDFEVDVGYVLDHETKKVGS